MNIEVYDGDRRALLALFALADDSPLQIASYMGDGEVLVARDGDEIIGHAQITPADDAGCLELKSLAVIPARQGKGVGGALVAAVVARCHARVARRLIVSTATADIGNLRFYQRQGFRMSRIVPDAFGPATGYPDGLFVDGIPLRDQVIFERDLGTG